MEYRFSLKSFDFSYIKRRQSISVALNRVTVITLMIEGYLKDHRKTNNTEQDKEEDNNNNYDAAADDDDDDDICKKS